MGAQIYYLLVYQPPDGYDNHFFVSETGEIKATTGRDLETSIRQAKARGISVDDISVIVPDEVLENVQARYKPQEYIQLVDPEAFKDAINPS